MAMQSVYLKENEGIAHNFVGQLSSANSGAAPWWSSFGSQSLYGESGGCGQIKSFSLEPPISVNQFGATKQLGRGAEHLLGKEHTNHFTIFPGMSFHCEYISLFHLYDFLVICIYTKIVK